MRHLLDTTDLTLSEIDEMVSLALDIIENGDKYAKACEGKKLATLFFEPSTRTRLSFEAAMLELGGSVLGFSEASSSSTAKGESVGDTIRTVSNYADIIAMRHPHEGAAFVAKRKTLVPLINAGDGGHAHPTQTLTDLLTIFREKGSFNNLTIGLCGDLKFGRTVHSLIKAMSRYSNIRFVLISPEELKVPEYIIKDVLLPSGAEYTEAKTIEEAIPELDILYMTRVQRERFATEEEYLKHRDAFILDLEKLKGAKEYLTIMHPLPRVNEIAEEVDSDKRAKYFEQALNGKYIRMALILTLLNWRNEPDNNLPESYIECGKCSNPHCISNYQSLKNLCKISETDGTKRCIYCENEIL